jgi:hypothetical protein
MPLLDHFHPPLSQQRHWESFHANWAGAIADALNETLLPEGYFAEEQTHLGARVEIDVATFQEPAGTPGAGTTATLPARVWSPPAPLLVLPAAFPDTFEILVFGNEGGPRLVAAIELVSPGNKDRAAHARAFTVKCASYLAQGVALVVLDIVTSRRGNLHNELIRLLGHPDSALMPDGADLYANAYRPVVRDSAPQIEAWPQALALGQPLPVVPLALDAETCLPLDLEQTYTAACQRRRIG